MSRMHSSRKGKSSSKKPFVTESPKWVTLGKSEIESLVIKLATGGNSSAMIGLILRDQYGVPNVRLATGSSIVQIMKKGKISMDIPEDLSALLKRVTTLNAYLKDHPKDLHNKRGLQLIEAKIRRLEKYYKRKGLLPQDWKYTLEGAELELSR